MKNVFILFLLISFYTNAQITDFKHISFTKADSIANIYKNADLNSLPKLAHLLTKELETDVEKFRAIYIWVSKNIKGDHSAVSKNSRKRKRLINNKTKLDQWNAYFNKILFKKLQKEKKTVCTGYAYLIRELATYIGLECKIIDGFGRNTTANVGELSIPNHSWNLIKLNRKWYLVDATWASGYTDLNTNTFIFAYNDGYFLTAPSLFIKSHFPLNNKWTLIKSDSLSTNQFINAPLIYGDTFKYKITPIFPEKMNIVISKNEEITFKLNSIEAINLNKIDIKIGNFLASKNTKSVSISKEKEIIRINYNFKIKGYYDFHILYYKKVIATYSVKVKN